jgi:NitT/TauT family transport system substrate-binding protein
MLAVALLLLLSGGAPSLVAAPPAGATADASAAGAPLPQRTRVVLGLIPIIPSATIFVPKDKGYFDAEGLDVDWEVVQVTSEAMAQVAAGNLQLAQATVGAALLNAFASGLDIRILAGMHGMPPSGPGGDPVIVGKPLWDSGVRDASGLRGRKVGVNGTGVFSEYGMNEAMKTAGMTTADVDLQIVAFPDMPAALSNSAIDAAFVPEPFATQAIEQGLAMQIVPEWIRGAQISLLVGGPTILRDRPTAEAFMRAYIRGLRDLATEGWTSPANAAIIERYTRVPANIVQKILPQYAAPDASINWQSLMDQQQLYLDRGYLRVSSPLDLTTFNEDGPRQAALRALGP